MKSLSIVYSQRSSCHQLSPHKPSLRSLDEYYARLLERQKQKPKNDLLKKQVLQRMKLKTSRNQRKKDKYNIIDTLNIVPIAIQGPILQQKRDVKSRQNGYSPKKVESNRIILKGLNICQIDNQQQDKIFPFRKNTIQKNNSLKLKCYYKSIKQQTKKQTVLVLSANLIINQIYFWREQYVQQSAAKVWRTLQQQVNIVWVCKKQSSCKKILKFGENKQLRIDGIYYISPKLQRLQKVSYTLIQNDFQINDLRQTPLLNKKSKNMLVISGIESDQNINYDQVTYESTIPILKCKKTIVHLIKIDSNDKNRPNKIIKILSKSQLPMPFQINNNLKRDKQYMISQKTEIKQQIQIEPKDILKKMENLKIQCLKQFSQSYSLNLNDKTGAQGNNSLNFMIGDIIRRNYKIYHQYFRFYQQYQNFKLEGQSQKQKKYYNQIYKNIVYLWSQNDF